LNDIQNAAFKLLAFLYFTVYITEDIFYYKTIVIMSQEVESGTHDVNAIFNAVCSN